jgi:hypothetical protein
MRKFWLAVSVGVAALATAYLGFARDLITPELVRESLVATMYVGLSVLSSWLITATVGTRHKAMAICSGAGMYLAVQGWRWYALDVAFAPWQLFVALIVGVSSPLLFAAFRAVLARFGIVLKVNEDTGAVEAIKVDSDETIWIGSPTVPDVKREGVKPEPSNE